MQSSPSASLRFLPHLLAVLSLAPACLPAAEPATDAPASAAAPAVDLKSRGEEHLRSILAEPWAAAWKEATLKDIRRVEQRTGVTFPTKLPPVWTATISAPDQRTGYLMWDATGAGDLVEFALDADLEIRSDNAAALRGLPALQQFAVEDAEGKIASGCVPTSAASLVGWWIGHGQPAWRGAAAENDLQAITRRLRGRLRMMRFPDKDGFTDDGMALAGAQPADMAAALRADAAEHRVSLHAALHVFSFKLLKEEINAGRPVLLSCTVRVPHKPDLSWGHEVAAVGWATLAGKEFAGISDNFFPVKHPGTIRWIRTDAFSTLITVRPAAPDREK